MLCSVCEKKFLDEYYESDTGEVVCIDCASDLYIHDGIQYDEYCYTTDWDDTVYKHVDVFETWNAYKSWCKANGLKANNANTLIRYEGLK